MRERMDLSENLNRNIIFMKYVDNKMPYWRIAKTFNKDLNHKNRTFYEKIKPTIQNIENQLITKGLIVKKTNSVGNKVHCWLFPDKFKNNLIFLSGMKITKKFAEQSPIARISYIKEKHKPEISTLKRLAKKHKPFIIAKIISKVINEHFRTVSAPFYYFILDNRKYENIVMQKSLDKLVKIFNKQTIINVKKHLTQRGREDKKLIKIKLQAIKLFKKLHEIFPMYTISVLVNEFLPKKLRRDRQLYQNFKTTVLRYNNINVNKIFLLAFHNAIKNVYNKYYKPLVIRSNQNPDKKLNLVFTVLNKTPRFYWNDNFFKIFLNILWIKYGKKMKNGKKILPSRKTLELELKEFKNRIASYVDRKYNGWLNAVNKFEYIAESGEHLLNFVGDIFQGFVTKVLNLKSHDGVYTEVLRHDKKRFDHVMFITLDINDEQIPVQIAESKLTLTAKRLLEIYKRYALSINPLNGNIIRKIMITYVRRQGIDSLTKPLKKCFRKVEIIRGNIPIIKLINEEEEKFEFFLVNLLILEDWIKENKNKINRTEYLNLLNDLNNFKLKKWLYFIEKYQPKFISLNQEKINSLNSIQKQKVCR